MPETMELISELRSDLEKEQENAENPPQPQKEETPAENSFDAEFTEEEKDAIEERLKEYGSRQPGTSEVVTDLRNILEKEPEKN